MGSLLISRLQHEHRQWMNKNFGISEDPTLGNDRSVDQFMGMVEELGELGHVILKSRQGIREGMDPITARELEADAIADLWIFCMGYCSRRQLDMEEIILSTWEKVKRRDWNKDPLKGSEGEWPVPIG